mgnify:CR=1 FL=1
MKVIIIGAGGVGYVAAETISDMHDVLVIENDADIADTVKNRLNVSVLHEDGTNPKTIKYAIDTHDADVIISTLGRDDSNLFVCLMAKRFKPEIITVASITNPDYVIDTTDDGVPGVDVIISPELITAEKMYKLCVLENAVEYEVIPHFNVSMAIFQVSSESPLISKVVMNTFSMKDATVFAIYRNEELYFQVDTMEIHSGDRICIMGTDEALAKYNTDLGVEEVARDFVILGGTIVGRHLANLLSKDEKKRYVRIIERNQDRCRELSRLLTGVVIINGDFTEPELQTSENIFRSDCLVSVTNQDDTNLLMCMSGQKYNTSKIVSRYLKKEYMDIFIFTGLDTIIGFDRIVSNEIAKCVMSEAKVILRMRNHDEQFFIHDVSPASKLFNTYYGDLILPNGLRILAIHRGDDTIYPSMDTQFQDGDRVIVFTNFTKDKDLAKVFGRTIVSES